MIDTERYQVFKDNYRDIAEKLEEINRSEIKVENIWLMTDGLKGQEIHKVMETYTETGIVTRSYNNYTREPVYHVPSYSGRTGESWEEILDRLESEMVEAEKRACWNQQDRENYALDEFF